MNDCGRWLSLMVLGKAGAHYNRALMHQCGAAWRVHRLLWLIAVELRGASECLGVHSRRVACVFLVETKVRILPIVGLVALLIFKWPVAVSGYWFVSQS